MSRPQRRRLFRRRRAEPVFIGGGRPVLDAGITLQPAQRLVPGRQRQPEQRQEGDDQREPECRRAARDAAAAADRLHSSKQRHDEERRRRPGTARAAPPRCARRAAQARTGALGPRSARAARYPPPLRRGLLGSKYDRIVFIFSTKSAGHTTGNLGSEAGESEARLCRAHSQFGSRSLASMSS